MATNTKATKSTEPKADKPKRRQLTDAERIAKAEAELEAIRKKAAAKSEKKVTALLDQRKALTDKQAETQVKINEINDQLQALGYTGDIAPADVEQPQVSED